MSRPRKSAPLPAPFERAWARYDLCVKAHVCEATAIKWLSGDQTVSEPYCRQLALGCQFLGISPPAGCKLAPPIGAESPPPSPRLASVPPAMEAL